jgi:hypothetical protein
VEDWQNFAFGGPGNRDDTFWLNRFLLHADLHLTQYVRCFVQGKSALSTDRDLPGGRRSIDLDELDLQNGFVDFNLPLAGAGTLTLRPGRQEILFGRQRLVGPLDWVNTRRTFDGGSAIFDFGGWKATAFYAQLVIVDPYDFNQPDPQTELWGACASGKLPGLPASLELYFFGLEKDTAANPGGFNGTVGREDRYTTGGHVFGAAGTTGLDFDLEGAYQFGSVGAGDADAFMFASQIGYKLAILPFAPRPYLGFDYASGDSAAGGDVNTFNQLFPTGHLHYGYMDFVGRQNAVDLSAGLSVQPLEKLTVEVDWHTFWRSDTSDALYDAGGAVLRSGAAGSSNDIGDEIDITARYAINRHLLLSGGYCHFVPGRFIEESGSAREVDWGYLSLQYTF